jgi:alpha-glucosidase
MTSDQLPPASSGLFKQLELKIRFFLGSLFYLKYAPHAYLYSFKRDRLEERFSQATAESATASTPQALKTVEPTARGVYFSFEQVTLTIQFLTADLVQITWQPGLLPIPYALVKPVDPPPIAESGATELSWPTVEFWLNETAQGWEVNTEKLQICISSEGSLEVYQNGHLLRSELPPRCEAGAWSHQARLKLTEALYGLGERAFRLNLRTPVNEQTQSEQTYRMWNYDAAGMYGTGSDPMYICIPVYISLQEQGSYLIFYENSFDGKFSFTDLVTVSFTGGALRYYITAGTPAELLERYTELTGRAPLPPQWALGYHQSRWGYRTEAAVRETVEQFRTFDLPLSAIHLDIDVQVGFRAFTLDPERFPLLGKFTQELAIQGVQFITILNPGVKYSRKSKLFIEGQMLDAFCKLPDGSLIVAPVWCGWSVFPDFTRSAVRQWWSRQYEFLLDLGVAGFWHDMNEPAAFIAWGDRSLPQVTQHAMEGRGGDHREAHNVYGLLQAKAGYESLCQYRPGQRPFIVSRAGWAGLQRYAWTWTGDVECTWGALRQTIATVLGLGLSGVPYSGSDIGGFQGNPEAELYLRWFQMATFMPFYRSHCSNNVEYRAPWTYGEPYLSILRDFLKLRYRLMPYFYTLAWQSTQKGYPLVRPLFWYHADQAALWNVDDCFYLGEALLVYPVLAAGVDSQQITLSPGDWYNFWDDRFFSLAEPQSLEVEVSLAQMPLFVKAGSVLPMLEQNQLMLHLYLPQANGEAEYRAELYGDAGDGYGAWRLDRFRLIRYPDGVELLREQQGDYPFAYEAVRIFCHGFEPRQVWSGGVEVDFDLDLQPLVQPSIGVDALFEQVFLKF